MSVKCCKVVWSYNIDLISPLQYLGKSMTDNAIWGVKVVQTWEFNPAFNLVNVTSLIHLYYLHKAMLSNNEKMKQCRNKDKKKAVKQESTKYIKCRPWNLICLLKISVVTWKEKVIIKIHIVSKLKTNQFLGLRPEKNVSVGIHGKKGRHCID